MASETPAELYYSSVEEAVTASLSRKKPLVVVLVDETESDGGSTLASSSPLEEESDKKDSLLKHLESQKNRELLRKRSIPLKLIKSSQDYNYFQQIFPVEKIPSVYFIKRNKIMDVLLNDDMSKEEFDKRLIANLLTVESLEELEEGEDFYVLVNVGENRQTQEQTTSSIRHDVPQNAAESSSNSSNLSPSNTRNTAENARSPTNEPKSITESSSVSPEMTRYQERLKKQRKAELEERKRIMNLVEADRKEREARGHKDHDAPRAEIHGKEKSAQGKPINSSSLSKECALSIRLFDGKAVKHTFQAEDTLATVRNWLDNNRTDGNQAYSFFQNFPKRLFGEGEEYETLRELSLTPSATLILKPARNSTSAYNGSSGWIYSGAKALSGAVYSFLGIGVESHPQVGEDQQSTSEDIAPEQSVSPGLQESRSRYRGGNVHTLRSDDEDKVTYNGNQLNLEDDAAGNGDSATNKKDD